MDVALHKRLREDEDDGGDTAPEHKRSSHGNQEQGRSSGVNWGEHLSANGVNIYHGDVLDVYERWPSPTVIVSDGAYGLAAFPGDPNTPSALAEWYRPHIKRWSQRALPSTTLWFWCTEIGWANVHPLLDANGWDYVHTVVWDKGLAHVAGNCNTQTLRHLPVVTEICVQYVRRVYVSVPNTVGNDDTHCETQSPLEQAQTSMSLTLKDWLRHEWRRSGLPLSKSNEACGVANAVTRKYLTADAMWYFPPPEAFEKLATYANTNGAVEGRPYFALDGHNTATASEWSLMRAKFHCPLALTNVWTEPALRGKERLRANGTTAHLNQKPERLMTRLVECSSDEGDVVWEPFGGTCTTAFVCIKLRRRCFSAEQHPPFFQLACGRLCDASPCAVEK